MARILAFALTLSVVAAALVGVALRVGFSRATVSPADSALSAPEKAASRPAFSSFPLAFVENRGQLDSRALFVARGRGGRTFLGKDGFVTTLVRTSGSAPRRTIPRFDERVSVERADVFFTFEDASPDPEIAGEDPQSGIENYYLAQAPVTRVENVRRFSRVRYRGLYPGVDMEFSERDGSPAYDLILGPEADLSRIVIRCDGAEKILVDDSGAMIANTRLGSLVHAKPAAFLVDDEGRRTPTECRFVLVDDRRVGFVAPERSLGQRLFIDPAIQWWGRYLATNGDPLGSPVVPPGSSGEDEALAVALGFGHDEDDGDTYITGRSLSINYPTSANYQMPATSVQPNTDGLSWDAFVTKVGHRGTGLQYSTYLGAVNAAGQAVDDVGYGIAVDNGTARILGDSRTSPARRVAPVICREGPGRGC